MFFIIKAIKLMNSIIINCKTKSVEEEEEDKKEQNNFFVNILKNINLFKEKERN